MSNFLFIGQTPRFYPEIVGPHGSLIAEPGDVCEFETAPSDGLWIDTTDPVNDKAGRIWPPRPEAPEPEAEPEPEQVKPASTPTPFPVISDNGSPEEPVL